MILDKLIGPIAAITTAASLLLGVFGYFQYDRAEGLEDTLATERQQHKDASDKAVADRAERDRLATEIRERTTMEGKRREAETQSQNERERALLAELGRVRHNNASLHTAGLNASAGFAAQLDAAKTSADQLPICRSLVERGIEARREDGDIRRGLATVLVQDRAEGRRAIDALADATGYIDAARAQCAAAKPVSTP